MQDEAQAAAKVYQEQLDDLARRAQAAGRRITALPPEALANASVQRTFQEAAGTLTRTRNDLKQIPQRARAGTQADEVEKLIGELHEKAGDALREAGSEISAIESWVAIAEQQRRTGATGATGANGAAPAPTAPAAPAPTTEDSAGTAPPAR